MPQSGEPLEVNQNKKGEVSAIITYDNPANPDSSTKTFEVTNQLEENPGVEGEGLADPETFFNRRWPFKK